MNNNKDIKILRELTKRYLEVAEKPIQEERRRLWLDHNSLKHSRIPILVTFGMWNMWCRKVFGDHTMKCKDLFFREQERNLRMLLFHDKICDDYIFEPWINLKATLLNKPENLWGPEISIPNINGNITHNFEYHAAIRNWEDMKKIKKPHHMVDEVTTSFNFNRLKEAIGDLIEINLDRGPIFQTFHADISTHIAFLRGLEQIMLDMHDSPKELHNLAVFLRDGILSAQEEAERKGDWSLTSQENQEFCYCHELEAPKANSGSRLRKNLWFHTAAQEFTSVSPAMHNEFLLKYQIPIIEKFGLVAYGCCEDLTKKINMLRKIKNLRVIAVAPVANVQICAEQIGQDYVFSWRPNPTNMVSSGFNEDLINQIIRNGLKKAKGCIVHIHLKDIETIEGDLSRLSKWVRIVRNVTDK